LPKAQVDSEFELWEELHFRRNVTLMPHFLHLLVIDEGIRDAKGNGVAGFTTTQGTNTILNQKGQEALKQRGSAVGTTDTDKAGTVTKYPKRYDLLVTTIAHELTHQLVLKEDVDGFDSREHTTEDDADILDATSRTKSAELATVKFTATVQKQLIVRTGEWVKE